jgi:excisionase family DNA binding protein
MVDLFDGEKVFIEKDIQDLNALCVLKEIPLVMNAPEAAEFLRIDIQSLYRLVRKRKVPFWKCGKEYRFAPYALLKMLGQGQKLEAV